MSLSRIELLRKVLEHGVGAEVVVQADSSGLRTGLCSYFSGLTQNQGPVCTIAPSGLKRHRVTVRFGKFAGECIAQMQSANDESKLVARALVQSVASAHDVSVLPAQDLESWTVTGSDFGLDVIVKDISEPASEETITRTAKAVMVPLMAAMAELIGYDEETQEESPTYYVQEVEGRPSEVTIIRRERSRRNRLLCLAIHGHRCSVCNCVPSETYGDAGSIIEVHHLEPLALIEMPRAYDPRTDLVPLCPNCHRAIHVRKPVPYSIDELKEMVRRANE